jgi:ferredoxin
MDGLTRMALGAMVPYLHPKACNGCGLCVQACPSGTVTVHGGKALLNLDPSKCGDCLACHDACPRRAIDVKLHWLTKLMDEPKAALRPDAM